jgi:N12 class adenine-specific DNA methylase
MKESDNNNFVEQTEYANDQLNDMMKKYNENQDKAKLFHELRKNELISKNLEENIKNREEQLEQTKLEIAESDKASRKALKEKLASIDEQINKMLERKNDIDKQSNELKASLDYGKI